MSVVAIRAALEKRLDAMASPLATAWENQDFKPPSAKTPYQRAWMLLATPDNPETGVGYRELGFFQVTLFYPIQEGSGTAAARAKLIREHFPRNLSLTQDGIVVTVDRTPEIGNGTVDEDRWTLPVKIPFHANIF